MQTFASLTGVNVIQYYQSGYLCGGFDLMHADIHVLAILYKSLGISSHMILALAAVYGTMAFLSNALTTKYLNDQWGRRKYVNFMQVSHIILVTYHAQDDHYRPHWRHANRNIRRCDATRVPEYR